MMYFMDDAGCIVCIIHPARVIYGCSQPRELQFIDFNHVYISADGPSPREKLADQLASVLEMRRRKQKVCGSWR